MKNTTSPASIYPYWFKPLGLLLVVASVAFFFYRLSSYAVFDLAGASFPVAFGLMMIFFSREKTFDERIAYLKFKSLAISVPAAATVVMAINYSQNFGSYSVETDRWYSISAFEYLAVALLIAIGVFHVLKHRE